MMLHRDWFARTTATVRDTYPGFGRLPTAFANWLAGFMMGHRDGEQHARALDSILQALPPYASGTEIAAIREARTYLALHNLADFQPPPQKRSIARMPR